MREPKRIILVELDATKRDVLKGRLHSQGYEVDALGSGVEAADLALGAPPSALVADLWMPGVSGVQLCRLLRSELATEQVPIILRGSDDTPRQRFWADRAGATAYVVKGRMGELVRVLARSIGAAAPGDGFFQLHPDEVNIRDRVSELLDAALYESVLAAEVRSLSTCETLPSLFDLLSQFMCQVVTYRWLAVATEEPAALWVHAHPQAAASAVAEARASLSVAETVPVHCLEDEDAVNKNEGPEPLLRDLRFGVHQVGRIAVSPAQSEPEDIALINLVAKELGGPMRIVTLVEQTKRLAAHDVLTGLLNRRAFCDAMRRELSRAERVNVEVSLLLLDIDHFKSINDNHGHQAGDRVLAAVGQALLGAVRDYDYPARWGGEEFVVALPQMGAGNLAAIAERIRLVVEGLDIESNGTPIPVTASVGAATRRAGEELEQLVERADKAMYEAKTSGRNRVVLSSTVCPSNTAARELDAVPDGATLQHQTA